MVYESDYSTRRVYSGSSARPGYSSTYSYSTKQKEAAVVCTKKPAKINPLGQKRHTTVPRTSVEITSPFMIPPMLHHLPRNTLLAYAPGLCKGRTVPRMIPHIAHQRLASVGPPPHDGYFNDMYNSLESARLGSFGPSVKYVVMMPQRRRHVPLSKVTYIEDVTNTSEMDEIARQTRIITGDADNLLMRLTYPSPMYSLRSIPLRSASELRDAVDIRRQYVHERNYPHIPYSQIKNDLYRMYMYYEPEKPLFRGRGHLACLSFVGGRPIPKRRRFYPDDKISSEIDYRSYYWKLRDMAAHPDKQYRRPLYQPIYRSKKTLLGLSDDAKKDKKVFASKWEKRALASDDKPAAARKVSVPQTPKDEGPHRPNFPRQDIDITVPGPKKSVSEIPKDEFPKIENLPEQSVFVRSPRASIQYDLPQPIEAKVEETVKVPPSPTKSIAQEPEPEVQPEPEPAPEPEPEPAPPAEEPKVEEVKQEEPTAPAAEEPKQREPEVPAEAPAAEEPVAANPPVEEPAKVEEASVTPEEIPPPAEEPSPVEAESPPQPTEESLASPEPAKEPEPAPTSEPEVSTEVKATEESAVPPSGDSGAEPTPVSATEEDASNKGEDDGEGVIDDADVQIVDDEVTLDEVCDVQVEENDLEIDETPVEPESLPPPEQDTTHDMEPLVTEEETPNTGVSIIIADMDGKPLEDERPPTDSTSQSISASAAVSAAVAVEQYQADAERRRSEFARLLEEHHEIVVSVQRLEQKDDQIGSSSNIEDHV